MIITSFYQIILFKSLHTGVEISLESTTYAVDENGGSREVCAVLSSGTQIQLSIGLVMMNGSALSMSLWIRKILICRV